MRAGPGRDFIKDYWGGNVGYGGPGRDWIDFGSLDGRFAKSAQASRVYCGSGYDTVSHAYKVRRGCERAYWK
jgi:hypothetical protein